VPEIRPDAKQGGALWVRDIILQVCAEKGVDIIQGVLSRDHAHIFEVPPRHHTQYLEGHLERRADASR
jgi:REP element-mobilizing transposase RayT